MGTYLSTDIAAPVIRLRLGQITLDTIRYGEARQIGGVAGGHPQGWYSVRVG